MKKIISRKELATALLQGDSVNVSDVSKKLNRVCKLWESRKEVSIVNGVITNNWRVAW